MGVSGLGVQVSAWEPPSWNGVAVGSGRNPRSNGREYNFTISDFSIQKIARFIGVSSNRIVIFVFWGLFVFCIQIFCKTYWMTSYASVMGNNLTHNPSLGAQLLRMFVSQDVMHSRWRCAIRKMTMCMITPDLSEQTLLEIVQYKVERKLHLYSKDVYQIRSNKTIGVPVAGIWILDLQQMRPSNLEFDAMEPRKSALFWYNFWSWVLKAKRNIFGLVVV